MAEKYKLILTSRCINTKTYKCLEAYIDKAIYTEISFGLISFFIPLYIKPRGSVCFREINIYISELHV